MEQVVVPVLLPFPSLVDQAKQKCDVEKLWVLTGLQTVRTAATRCLAALAVAFCFPLEKHQYTEYCRGSA